MIDWKEAEYSVLDKCWMLKASNTGLQGLCSEQLEILLPGSPEQCETIYFPLAEIVIPQIPSLVLRAENYLKAFINAANIKQSTGAICLSSLQFGTWPEATENEFQMSFRMHRDDYGEWFVRFHYGKSTGQFWPYFFAREDG